MVQLKNIDFSYQKRRKLFDNVSLTLKEGVIYGLLGKNGSGKSTLLKQMCGMLFPDSGSCRVFGYEASERLPEMLQNIYLVPEEFELPSVNIRSYSEANAVFYPAFSHEALGRYLNEFEIPSDVRLSTLSYGQKKKFLIAFGLATNARLLILDEPTNGLDIPSKSQFRKTIASSFDESKIIIISTHQVRDLENLIDTIVVLEQGRIIFNRSTADISDNLAFEHNLNGYQEEEILYSEEITGKRAGIVRNLSGEETRIDLELLFNGLIKNSETINSNFKKTVRDEQQL
jgi:ABC-2 type transport system ATP-binding protein